MEERPTEKGGGGGLILNFVLKFKDIKGECPFDNGPFPFVEEGASSSARVLGPHLYLYRPE